MPGDPGVTVVTMLVCFYHFAHKAAGASGARHSPCPLIQRVGCAEQDSREKCAARSRSRGCLKFEIRTRGRALAGLPTAAHGPPSPKASVKSVFALASLGYAGHASPFRSCVAAPRVARKGEAWCPWPESNQHSLRNSILSRARLPIPPQGLFATNAERPTSRSRRNIAGGGCRSTRDVTGG
jgi:hypothetical protein